MMTDVLVAPSLGGLLVACVLLLLTGIVAVVVIAPTDWELMVSSGIDAVESEYTTLTWHVTNGMAKVGYTRGCAPNPH